MTQTLIADFIANETLPEFSVQVLKRAGETLELLATAVDGPRSIEIVCSGVQDFAIDPVPGKLQSDRTGVRLAAYGPQATIFGNAPLPDPPRFFFDFYRGVKALGYTSDPTLLLNGGPDLQQWLSFVYSRTYRLLSGPVAVVELAKELLEAQAVASMVLPDEPVAAPAESLQAVEIGKSWVVCADASIRWT